MMMGCLPAGEEGNSQAGLPEEGGAGGAAAVGEGESLRAGRSHQCRGEHRVSVSRPAALCDVTQGQFPQAAATAVVWRCRALVDMIDIHKSFQNKQFDATIVAVKVLTVQYFLLQTFQTFLLPNS